MAKYRKKPVVVDAWPIRQLYQQIVDREWSSLALAITHALLDHRIEVPDPSDHPQPGLRIATPEGIMFGGLADWLICGVEGEFYPCADSVFQKTYAEAFLTADDMTRSTS
jgi:hypothetical protein